MDTDWLMQTNTRVSQQIGFKEKLEKDAGITMFIYHCKAAKVILKFSLDLVDVKNQYKHWNTKKQKLFNEPSNSKFVTRKWNLDQENASCDNET